MACCACEELTITLTGNQSGIGLANAGVVRCNNASLLTIHGLGQGYAGQRVVLISVGAGQVDIANQSTTEAITANRIVNGVTGTISLAAGVGTAQLEYDGVTERWRVIDHEQGAWISPAFAAGNFAGGGTNTWTVDSGDVVTYAYMLRGRTLTWRLILNSTTVGGTPAAALSVVVPGGFTLASDCSMPIWADDNGTQQFALMYGLSAGTTVALYKTPGGNWSSSTNNTRIRLTAVCEVQ